MDTRSAAEATTTMDRTTIANRLGLPGYEGAMSDERREATARGRPASVERPRH